ncbi:MAG: flagellar regulator YcgR PilZN domain-containing protein [Pseudomonadales bacterium]|nr:flagellar regulator YcgR PilZN domain-containing protein [Pseudomonadales bacterium]
MPDDEDRYYYSPGDIFGVFRAMQNDRSSINIQFRGQPAGLLFNSLVLEANLPGRYVLLDEMTPREGHRLAEAGELFSLRASVNGIRVQAKDLKVAKVLNNESGLYYRVAFPPQLLYLQRRDAFRAHVPASMRVNVKLNSEERDASFEGSIINMSATGFRFALDGEIKPALETLEKFEAAISIAYLDMELECGIEIRFAAYDPTRKQTICGCRMLKLGRMEQQLVNRFVTQLQRESIT